LRFFRSSASEISSFCHLRFDFPRGGASLVARSSRSQLRRLIRLNIKENGYDICVFHDWRDEDNMRFFCSMAPNRAEGGAVSQSKARSFCGAELKHCYLSDFPNDLEVD
jgi:hypothetical protein